jgi:hypothetical protein
MVLAAQQAATNNDLSDEETFDPIQADDRKYIDFRARWLGVTNWTDVNYPWLLIILPMIFGLIVVAIYQGPDRIAAIAAAENGGSIPPHLGGC